MRELPVAFIALLLAGCLQSRAVDEEGTPAAAHESLRISPASVEVIPGFHACLRASLIGADGIERPLTSFDGIVVVENLEPQVAGGDLVQSCRSPEDLAHVTGYAPGKGSVRFAWDRGSQRLEATVEVRVLPKSFRLTAGPVRVPVGTEQPIAYDTTVVEPDGTLSDWSQPYASLDPIQIRVDVGNEEVGRLHQSIQGDLAIEGLAPGTTQYTLKWFVPAEGEFLLDPQDVTVLNP